MEFLYKPINPFQNDGLSSKDKAIIDGMRNTAYVCGYRGGDVEYAVHQALKRIPLKREWKLGKPIMLKEESND